MSKENDLLQAIGNGIYTDELAWETNVLTDTINELLKKERVEVLVQGDDTL
jgi:hypothetical protein